MTSNESPFKRIDGGAPDPKKSSAPLSKVSPQKPYEDPSSVFAEGLPEWNLDPPGDMIRRHERA